MKTLKRYALLISAFSSLTLASAANAAVRGSCVIADSGSQENANALTSFNLTEVNPEGHYGLMLKGAGSGFDVRVLTDLCPGDGVCASDEAATRNEIISVTLKSLSDGSISNQELAGAAFRNGSLRSVSFATVHDSIKCSFETAAL